MIIVKWLQEAVMGIFKKLLSKTLKKQQKENEWWEKPRPDCGTTGAVEPIEGEAWGSPNIMDYQLTNQIAKK